MVRTIELCPKILKDKRTIREWVTTNLWKTVLVVSNEDIGKSN